LEEVASGWDPNQQRRVARYLVQLSDVLEQQDELKGFQTVEDAAKACRAVLGEEQAAALADRLGWSAFVAESRIMTRLMRT